MKPALVQDAVHRQKAIEPTQLSLTNENRNSKVRKSSRRSESAQMFCSFQILRRNTSRNSSAQRLSSGGRAAADNVDFILQVGCEQSRLTCNDFVMPRVGPWPLLLRCHEHFTNRFDHEFRLIELDVMAAMRGDDQLPVARHRRYSRMVAPVFFQGLSIEVVFFRYPAG
jgi:hypothetical protein